MSNNDKVDTVLGELTPEQFTGLLKKVRELELAKAQAPTTHEVERSFWHVVSGEFDTMVDVRDAPTEDDARNVAASPLQPWYVRQWTTDFYTMLVKVSRNEYIDWLRRGVR